MKNREFRGKASLHALPDLRSTLHERAQLAALLGDDACCERELHEAHRLYTEMGATGHAERVGRELEALTGGTSASERFGWAALLTMRLSS